jgi:hypothetical protein
LAVFGWYTGPAVLGGCGCDGDGDDWKEWPDMLVNPSRMYPMVCRRKLRSAVHNTRYIPDARAVTIPCGVNNNDNR